ncbi:MAG: hypothetical protein A2177_05915 [Spirochaetes bacterium RBG_13_68_11]|nr:MAG: hypothetical protein A2177_05915 [Spirochaetes bacterium RBG_13_68_11]
MFSAPGLPSAVKVQSRAFSFSTMPAKLDRSSACFSWQAQQTRLCLSSRRLTVSGGIGPIPETWTAG